MKTLLIFLMLSVSAMAESPWQGPRPAVTQSELPDYIVDAIKERLNDPGSMEVVSWTLPKLETSYSAGVRSGWWYIAVMIRANNQYGGKVVRKWDVKIRNEQVERCSQRATY